jgi:hypothetical protein
VDYGNSVWPLGLAHLYKDKGDFITALYYAEQALERNPEDPTIQNLVKELESK